MHRFIDSFSTRIIISAWPTIYKRFFTQIQPREIQSLRKKKKKEIKKKKAMFDRFTIESRRKFTNGAFDYLHAVWEHPLFFPCTRISCKWFAWVVEIESRNNRFEFSNRNCSASFKCTIISKLKRIFSSKFGIWRIENFFVHVRRWLSIFGACNLLLEDISMLIFELFMSYLFHRYEKLLSDWG